MVGRGLVQAMVFSLAVVNGTRREEAGESPPEPTCADGAGTSSHTLHIPASWITLGRVCADPPKPKYEPVCHFAVSLWVIPMSRQGRGQGNCILLGQDSTKIIHVPAGTFVFGGDTRLD